MAYFTVYSKLEQPNKKFEIQGLLKILVLKGWNEGVIIDGTLRITIFEVIEFYWNNLKFSNFIGIFWNFLGFIGIFGKLSEFPCNSRIQGQREISKISSLAESVSSTLIT